MVIFFMFLFYFLLIAYGSNRKIEAAIKKYQKETNVKYKIDRSWKTMLYRLVKFFFINKVSQSEFDREFNKHNPLEYHIKPADEEENHA